MLGTEAMVFVSAFMAVADVSTNNQTQSAPPGRLSGIPRSLALNRRFP